MSPPKFALRVTFPRTLLMTQSVGAGDRESSQHSGVWCPSCVRGPRVPSMAAVVCAELEQRADAPDAPKAWPRAQRSSEMSRPEDRRSGA